MPPCLIKHCKVRIKGKGSNREKRITQSHLDVVAVEKGAFESTTVGQLTYVLMIVNKFISYQYM